MTYDPFSEPPLPKLPVGVQAFETLRGQGYLYVDKTRWVHRMVTQGMFYFLARPRRLGKSLLVSTLRCLFEGRRELFEGLWIAEEVLVPILDPGIEQRHPNTCQRINGVSLHALIAVAQGAGQPEILLG
jgi:hypothetical protein